jgi:hypothetical protein
MEDGPRVPASRLSAPGPAQLRERPVAVDSGAPLPRAEEMPVRRQQPTGRRRARLPTAAWLCFAVTLANGIAWGLIVPLFQTPDEPGHVAYVQYVAETGKPPTGRGDVSHFSEEQRNLLSTLRWKQIQRRRHNRVPGTATYRKRLERTADSPANRVSGGGYTTATNNPPLYYYAAAAVYRLSPWTALPDRVHVLRLFSALFAAITVLFVFLFLRELLPSTPWAWSVGALAVGFQPMFGFTSSGVTSDAVLYVASAGIFYMFARSFRRGLTPYRGVAIVVLAAVGLLAKTTMLGLAPGIAFGLLALALSAEGERRREAIRGAWAALGVVAVPLIAYMVLNSMVWDRSLWFGTSGVPALSGILSGGLLDFGSYMWQFYLPRLPFMDSYFAHYPLRSVWFDGFIGEFGWLDYGFPRWVYHFSLALAFILLALVARQLIGLRNVLRSRLLELATYVLLALGLVTLIAGAGYLAQLDAANGYEQPRYLFPLLALYGALIALAARGAGKRYGPAVGVFLVCLAIAHTAAAMLLTLTRYYG